MWTWSTVSCSHREAADRREKTAVSLAIPIGRMGRAEEGGGLCRILAYQRPDYVVAPDVWRGWRQLDGVISF